MSNTPQHSLETQEGISASSHFSQKIGSFMDSITSNFNMTIGLTKTQQAYIIAGMMGIFGMTKMQAQQAFSKRVIDTANNKITGTTWDLANGTNHQTVDGPKYFDSYANNGMIRIYNQNTDTRYEANTNNQERGIQYTVNDEPIGNATASYTNPDQTINRLSFVNQNNPSDTIPIHLNTSSHAGTINGNPNTSPVKILRYQNIIENINSLPDNTRIFLNSRWGSISSGGMRNGIAEGIKKENGVWIEPPVSPRGDNLDHEGPTLGLNDPANPWHTVTVAPNPAKEFIRFNDGLAGNNNYDIQIFSITGAKVSQIDHAPEDTNIDVSYLKPGMYLLVATDPKSGNKFVKKIIKQ